MRRLIQKIPGNIVSPAIRSGQMEGSFAKSQATDRQEVRILGWPTSHMRAAVSETIPEREAVIVCDATFWARRPWASGIHLLLLASDRNTQNRKPPMNGNLLLSND